jgi:type I restriction enzyme S subunit
MKRWPIKRLGDFVATKGGSVDPSKFPNEVFDLYSIPAYDSGEPEVRSGHEIGSAKQIVESRDVLLSRIVPHIRRAWVLGEARGRRLIASGEWIVFRSPDLHPRFLRYFVLGDPFHARFMQTVSGVGGSLLRAKASEVAKIEIPVPPLAEQERVLKLLDDADELRKLRAQADRRSAALIAALFNAMFGDPLTNPKRWPVMAFADLIAGPLRNGVSPAKQGAYEATVFTLSAITGVDFNDAACKEAFFAKAPDRNSYASDDLFLICRGNGNRHLVGRGRFPRRNTTTNVVFPDTMIAAVPKLDRLLPQFLEAAWNLPATRDQIESGARTTNGAFKINQTVIEQVRLLLPPFPLQKEFAERVTEIRELEAEQAASRRRLEDLFQSLLHRAFNGEL